MNVEFELKYCATPQILSALQQRFSGEMQVISMETTYYDTPAGDFSARKITLRRRLENGVSVCTLKTPAGPIARGEYELRCDAVVKAVFELCKLAGLPELATAASSGLTAVCAARFTRKTQLLTYPEFTAELALDSGMLIGGGKEIPLCEVEFELKTGSSNALCDFAAQLAAEFSLVAEQRSKFRRALDLARGD